MSNTNDIDEKKINNAILEIMLDVNAENKKLQSKLIKVIVLLILCISGLSVYYLWSFQKFVSQYDFQTETVIDTNATNSTNTTNNGNINIKK